MVDTERKSLAELAKNVTLKSREGKAKLAWDKRDDWQKDSFDYRCTLTYQGRKYSFDFWQGRGITHAPTVEGVLDCLLSDASLGENTFEDFCGELGYDTDSRKAYAQWKAICNVTKRMKQLLADEYETFLYADRN